MILWIADNLGTAAALDESLSPDVSVIDVRDLVDKAGTFPEIVRQNGIKKLAASTLTNWYQT